MRFETRWVWPTIIASTVRVLELRRRCRGSGRPTATPGRCRSGSTPGAVPWWMTTTWTLTPRASSRSDSALIRGASARNVEPRGRAGGDELGCRLELRADDADLDAVDREHLRRRRPSRAARPSPPRRCSSRGTGSSPARCARAAGRRRSRTRGCRATWRRGPTRSRRRSPACPRAAPSSAARRRRCRPRRAAGRSGRARRTPRRTSWRGTRRRRPATLMPCRRRASSGRAGRGSRSARRSRSACSRCRP